MSSNSRNFRFKVIYADPPWDIDTINLNKWKSPLSDKYNTMTLEEIKKIPVEEISDDDCSLFLWTTHTYLEKAFEVIKAWGFKYHCCITWDKISGWSCNGFHRRTELCLFAYKGKMNIKQDGSFIPTLIVEKSRKHSQKPDSLRAIIKRNTPEPRIELFARQRYEGWEYYGDQLSPDIQRGLEGYDK